MVSIIGGFMGRKFEPKLALIIFGIIFALFLVGLVFNFISKKMSYEADSLEYYCEETVGENCVTADE